MDWGLGIGDYINANTVPTLCQYGGKDFTVGIVHYSYLYNAFKETNIENKIYYFNGKKRYEGTFKDGKFEENYIIF